MTECSLPMYELTPELATHIDSFHQYIKDEVQQILPERSICNNSTLIRPDYPLSELWNSDKLLWTQICGQPLHEKHEKLNPIGTFNYDFEGCTSGTYCSVIIVKEEEAKHFHSLEALAGCRLAANSYDSWSGCVSLQNEI